LCIDSFSLSDIIPFQIVTLLLAEKFDRWTANRKEAVDRLIELADVFSGTIPLTRVEKNGNEEINSLT
jgi:hypothetical protein